MIKKFVLAAAFVFLPTAAMAQDHSAHHAPARKEAAAEHHKAGAHHKNFAEQLLELRADLKLTEAQVTKLKALSAKMAEHHAGMGKDAAHDVEMEEKMHSQLREVFTAEQMKKVHGLMVKHAGHACGGNGKEDKCVVHPKQ